MLRLEKAGRSTRFRDSRVLLRDGRLVEITSRAGEPLKGLEIRTSSYSPRIGIKLPWDRVGVFVYRGLKYDQEIEFTRDDVVGKCVVMGGILSVWYPEWFMSKVDH